jgi:hypothetical protein
MNLLKFDCFNACNTVESELKCNLNVQRLEIYVHNKIFDKISLIFNVFYQLNGGSAIQQDCFYFHKKVPFIRMTNKP